MGARVYIPVLGRFLQVDPVEGGTDNSYAYANDPVNQFDLDSRAIPVLVGIILCNVARTAATHVARAAVKYIAKPAVNYVTKKVAPVLAKKAVALSTRVASQAWTKDSAGSRVGNLTRHFNDHGKAMGYKTPFQYTLAAARNRMQAPMFKNLPSGSKAYLGPTKNVTFVYNGRIASYFKPKPKQWNRW